MITAMCPQTRSIGHNDGRFPWDRIKGDFRHFKKTTMGLDDNGDVRKENGHPMITGRKTLESFKGRIPPGRPLIIMSRLVKGKPKYKPEGLPEGTKFCVVCSIHEAKKKALEYEEEAGRKEPKVFVIGGGEIYKIFLQYTEELIVSSITSKEGDDLSAPIKFPTFKHTGFKIVAGGFIIDDPKYNVEVMIYKK